MIQSKFIVHPEGQTGQYLCKFVTDGAIAWVGGAVSSLCLVYIAIERYFAIIHPLRQRGRFTRRRLKVFIVLGWSFAFLINVPDFMSTGYYQPGLRLCGKEGKFGDVYSMRLKSFREHLRDMLLCKKRQTARGQAAVVDVGPTTGQPINGTEESVCNTAAPTPFSFSSAFKEEMVTTAIDSASKMIVLASSNHFMLKFMLSYDGTIAWVGGAVSILCLVYIAVEGYFAIIHPLRQRDIFTRRRLKVFIGLGWSFAFFINVPDFMSTGYYRPDLRSCESEGKFGDVEAKVDGLVWMVLAGIVPVSIMVYLYSRVVRHLWFKPVENLEASQSASLRYRKQVTITLITVSVIYAVSWIPNLTAYVLKSWDGVVMGSWYDKSGTLSVTFNPCINPVLYSMLIKSFREHLRDMLSCKKRQTTRGQA
ncbi:hypothetical protein ACROYT_G037781 [Oculina patagonica]